MSKETSIQKIYNLTPMQEGMLFHALLDKENDPYVEQSILDINGYVESDVFDKALNLLIKKHDILRTVFIYDKVKKPQQVVLKERKIKLHDEDITHLADQERDSYLEAFARKDKEKGFNLSKDLLIRMSLFKTHKDNYKLIFSFHHMILDGWSIGLFFKDLISFYSDLKRDRQPKAYEAYPYQDYIKWLDRQNKSISLSYWKRYLAGYENGSAVPTSYVCRDEKQYAYGSFEFELNRDTTKALENMANKNGVTLSTVVQTLWGILLSKYNNTDDVVFGSVFSGRGAEVEGIDHMLGLFINTLPLRIKYEDNTSFHELIGHVQNAVLHCDKHGFLPLSEIQSVTYLKNELINHIVAYENYAVDSDVEEMDNESNEIGFSIKNEEGFERANYEFLMKISPAKELGYELVYNKALYDAGFISNIEKHYKKLCKQIIENEAVLVRELDIVTEEERKQLVYGFNQTRTEYPREKTIHRIFEEQVEKTPQNIAAVYEDQKLTYRELNERANQLARILRNEGVGPDTIIGIMVERSLSMLVGILGILKAGGAYMPIDPEYPHARIEYMLSDSGTPLLLVQQNLMDRVAFVGKVIALEDERIWQQDIGNLEHHHASSNLAYIIYTSGSTGRPKGNLTTHYNVTRVVKETNYIDISENDSLLQLSNYAFDGSVFDIYGALLNGAKLVCIDKDCVMNLHKLCSVIEKENISVFFITTALFNALVDINVDVLKNIKSVLFGGERVSFAHVSKALKRIGKNKIIHVYGPTESTVFATCHFVNELDGRLDTVPIGKALSNTQIYIVNKNNQLQPVGVVGELYIGGDGLAKGYLNRPELTAEKFVPNPFVPGTMMYRTGDLAKWLPDGSIVFVGRIDHQVKIRGFRIELGEIEKELLNIEEIKEAVVIAIEDSSANKKLCAYFVADSEMAVSGIRERLMENLPDYMIPSYILQLDKIPLNMNGKIDTKELPRPETEISSDQPYAAPENEMEQKLVELWQDILGVERIGTMDNFFELGGHSLKATMLIARIHKEFEAQVPLREVFSSPTVKGIAQYIQNSGKNLYASIQPAKKLSHYPLSAAQKRLFIVNQLEGSNISYNMPAAIYIEGKLDVERFQQAFAKMLKRHESFRTSFELVEGEAVQRIHDHVPFEANFTKVSEQQMDKLVKEFVRPFDLTRAPLIRVSLAKINDEKYLLLLDMHHIISDGVSMDILVEELASMYEGKELDALKIQYKDYAGWQNTVLASGGIKKQEAYWLDMFKGEIPVLSMPTDFQRPAIQNFEGNTLEFETGSVLGHKIKKLCENTGTTLYMVLLAAYNVLLSKYSGQEDIVVGSPIAGRNHADLEKIVGMFVNTLAIRNFPQREKTFKRFLQEVKENTLGAFENQDYQFEELVEKLNIPRDMSRNPLFDTMFSMQNLKNSELKMNNLKFVPYEFDTKAAMFDITIDAVEDEENIIFDLQYCTKLFTQQTMERFATHFRNTLEAVVQNPEVKLGNLDLLTQMEKEEILGKFNEKKAQYNLDKTVPALFEAWAQKRAQKAAVIYQDTRITYKELNSSANQLARYLRQAGIEREDLVGVMLERTPDMVESILGIWKAQGAYIPLDVSYPAGRKLTILEDSGAKLVITLSEFVDQELKESYKGKVICLDLIQDTLKEQSQEDIGLSIDQDSLAYVLFTSGSTGKPKGVMIEHAGMVNHILAEQEELGLDESLIFAQNANHCFDISVWQFFGPLALGGTTAIYPNELVLEVGKFTGRAVKDGVTLLEVVPSYLSVMLDYIKESGTRLSSLKYLFITGEAARPAIVKKWFEICPGIKMVNAYGPAEASDDVTQYVMDKMPEKADSIPIGMPIQNMEIYILDDALNLCPVGVVGEICIAGIGVGRGYINNPEKTKESFLPNPFSGQQADGNYCKSTLYRTGDLGKWLPDGNIEFYGRKDYQVKVRGYRIELGEIESKLSEYEDIKEVAVIDLEDEKGSKYLCAYYTCHQEIKESRLKEHLLSYLPEYMIPAYFMLLKSMPYLPSGKIDRKALPKPHGSIGTEYAAPRNELEEKLAAIWQEVLNVAKVGIDDNFFDLGGHSLRATVMVSRIHKELDIQLQLKEVFSHSTIRELGDTMMNTAKDSYQGIGQAKPMPYYPVSSAQKRLYVVNRLNSESLAYNMTDIYFIEGELDVEKFTKAMDKLISRHESLRTSFEMVEDNPVQIVHKEIGFELEYFECTKENAANIIDKFVRPFDLSRAPLFRAGLIRLPDGKTIFVCDMHHIISDGTSLGIFMNDLASIYEEEQLLELHVQYKDFSAWQNSRFEHEGAKEQKQYWMNIFSKRKYGEIPVLELPLDYPRLKVRSHEGSILERSLDKALSSDLKELARSTGTTLYMVFLSAFNILLSRYSGQEDIIIGTPTAGRLHADTQNMIGMFVNTLAMRNFPQGDKSFLEFLEEVKSNTLEAFQNQDYQFEELVDQLDLRRDTGRNPLFDIMFAFQNDENPDLDKGSILFHSYEEYEITTTRFDISLQAEEAEDGIELSASYATKLFKKQTVENMIIHLRNILREVVNNPDILIKNIDMLTQAEKQELLVTLNETQVEYDEGLTIQQVFEGQVKKNAHLTAVVCKGKSLSYQELNEKANRIARVLRAKGVGPDSIVALMAERSVEMIAGIVGIMKAGGAYLPMDPGYPADRINYILEDSGCKVVLTMQHLREKAGNGIEAVCMDGEECLGGDPGELENVSNHHSLAYVIYTSGTTGRPKGVLIENRNVAYLVNGLHKVVYERYGNGLNISLFAPFVFDASVKQIFVSLLLGNTLHIIPDEIKWDIHGLIEYFAENKIDVSDGTPTLLGMLMQDDSGALERIPVRHFLIGGEPLPLKAVQSFMQRLEESKTVITNVYGPTECCVDATYFTIDREHFKDLESITIGRPMPNAKIYILDKHGALLHKGAKGEICIGGKGGGRGYLKRPELTSEKFIKDPFNSTLDADANPAFLYRTGDFGRILPDGNIEFAGRQDDQVKIRGHRIELGEIEAHISKYEGVKQVVVIDRENATGAKYLCAYFVSDTEITVQTMREYLSRTLPEYMIPSYFIRLGSIPYTVNGKVDKKSLPEPDQNLEEGFLYVKPANEIEEKLVEIWADVLNAPNIGIKHDFFALGGDSIKAIQVAARLRKYNLTMDVKDLFQNPTIEEVSGFVKVSKREIFQGIVKGEVELTPIQKDFFNRRYTDMHHYNQSVMLFHKEGLEEAVVNKVFTRIIEHHDALRMVYKFTPEGVMQYNNGMESRLFDLFVYDLSKEDGIEEMVQNHANRIQQSIDLGEGPLVKLGLFKTTQGDHLLITVHHLVMDGISWRILLEDLAIALGQAANGQDVVFQDKTDSFKEWSRKLKLYANSKKAIQEIEYWKSIEEHPVNRLPRDYEIKEDQYCDADTVSFELGESDTNSLLKEVNNAYNTEINDILVTALGLAVKEWCNENHVLIELEGHGREPVLEEVDITRTIGWFTSFYPVLLDMTRSMDLGYSIKAVKENLHNIPENGIGYGILKHMTHPDNKGGLEFKLRPEISFNYLGQFDQSKDEEEAMGFSPLFQGENIGGNVERKYPLDIVGEISDGKLSFNINYNRNEFKKQTMLNLSEKFKQNLKRMIDHCKNKGDVEITPSDLSSKGMTLDELDDVFAILEDKFGTTAKDSKSSSQK